MPDLDKTQERADFEAWFEREYPANQHGRREKYLAMSVQDLMRSAWQAARSLPPLQVEGGIDTAAWNRRATQPASAPAEQQTGWVISATKDALTLLSRNRIGQRWSASDAGIVSRALQLIADAAPQGQAEPVAGRRVV